MYHDITVSKFWCKFDIIVRSKILFVEFQS